MYAVIKSGGKQHRVNVDELLKVELLKAEKGETTKEENDLLNMHIGISHSNLEDLLLFTAAGGAYLWMLLSRWCMSFLIVWGLRVAKLLSC